MDEAKVMSTVPVVSTLDLLNKAIREAEEKKDRLLLLRLLQRRRKLCK